MAPLAAWAPPSSPALDWEPAASPTWLIAVVALGLSGFFAVLRTALERTSRGRVLARADEERRERLAPLLERSDALATSAGAFKIATDLVFTLAVFVWALGRGEFGASTVLTVLAVSVPALLVFSEALPGTLARAKGDSLLVSFLPVFHVLQLPFIALLYPLELVRKGARRAFGMESDPRKSRELVRDLWDVVEESERHEDLDESEREIIENVMEFHDVDAAEIMTPRTEIVAVEVQEGPQAVIDALATSNHSRIPVYDGNLDSIVGSVSARDVIQRMSQGSLEGAFLRELMRPATFVPETKLVSQLLGEFRRGKQKMAIVLDEYGGTAGLVTMGDVLAEIVGEMPDEFDQETPAPIVRLEDGEAEIDASTRISEVNEELDLDLPEEEDYETLAGYVLACMGRFPRLGERFASDGLEFVVVETSDRRVLRVRVRGLLAEKSA